MNQYLDQSELVKIYASLNKIKSDDLITLESYNETELVEKLNKFDENNKILISKCALHVALIGSGNGSYGQIKHNGNVLEITEILSNLGIKFNEGQNSKYKTDELTIRRIVRIFRYLTQKFIMERNVTSYLWRKYSNMDDSKKHVCFPGAENLITKQEDAKYLLETYQNLDTAKGTNFVERIKRIFQARGINF